MPRQERDAAGAKRPHGSRASMLFSAEIPNPKWGWVSETGWGGPVGVSKMKFFAGFFCAGDDVAFWGAPRQLFACGEWLDST